MNVLLRIMKGERVKAVKYFNVQNILIPRFSSKIPRGHYGILLLCSVSVDDESEFILKLFIMLAMKSKSNILVRAGKSTETTVYNKILNEREVVLYSQSV